MRLAICFLILLTPWIISGQTPSFVLNVDRTEMTQDQYLEVSFTVVDGQGKAFTPPDFTGWSVINGPSTSSQVSIINGIRNSSISYIYILAPKSLGSLSIGKASIQIDSKTFYTNPLTIKVNKPNPNKNLTQGAKALSKKDIFIMAKASPDKAYVGQQVLVEYKLYTAVNVDNYNIAHAPDFTGFHVNNTPRGSFDSREILNGRPYVTKVIYTASIYPVQSGAFTLEALRVRANVVTDDGNDPNAFFLLPTTEGVDLMSNSIPVTVLSLPDPVPPNYSGAVGKYVIASSIDQTEVKVNDAISITVYLEGDGDLNRVGKPYIQIDSTAFQTYEPKITKESTDYKNSGFIGMRELIYPLVALKPGRHRITPTFVYFDTDSQRYGSASPKTYEVNVSGAALVQKTKSESLDTESVKLLTVIQKPSIGPGHFVGSWKYFALLILPFMTWGGLFIYRKIHDKSNQDNMSSELIRKLKFEILRLANMFDPVNSSNADFHITIDKINNSLKEYFKLKWGLKPQTLSNTEWYTQIQRADLDESLKLKIKSFFEESDFVIFGGQKTAVQKQDMILKAKDIIGNT